LFDGIFFFGVDTNVGMMTSATTIFSPSMYTHTHKCFFFSSRQYGRKNLISYHKNRKILCILKHVSQRAEKLPSDNNRIVMKFLYYNRNLMHNARLLPYINIRHNMRKHSGNTSFG